MWPYLPMVWECFTFWFAFIAEYHGPIKRLGYKSIVSFFCFFTGPSIEWKIDNGYVLESPYGG